MRILPVLNARQWLAATVALAALLGVASVSDAFSWSTFTGAQTPRAKSKHQPAAAMRDRMLTSYHGQATELFTAIPGFGFERMRPLYKVVPFETPDLSTNEIETDKPVAPPRLLKDIFARSLESFHDPEMKLPAAKAGDNNPLGRVRPGIRFNVPAGTKVVSGGLQLRLLDLVGLTDPAGPKVYTGGKAFELQRAIFEEAKAARLKNPNIDHETELRIAGLDKSGKPLPRVANTDPETRPLDLFEMTGVAELRDGQHLFVRHRGNVIRMLGALRASEQCVKCHTDCQKGDLLGAFSYTFVDTNKALAKELEPAK